jgi:hypothetical protein
LFRCGVASVGTFGAGAKSAREMARERGAGSLHIGRPVDGGLVARRDGKAAERCRISKVAYVGAQAPIISLQTFFTTFGNAGYRDLGSRAERCSSLPMRRTRAAAWAA